MFFRNVFQFKKSYFKYFRYYKYFRKTWIIFAKYSAFKIHFILLYILDPEPSHPDLIWFNHLMVFRVFVYVMLKLDEPFRDKETKFRILSTYFLESDPQKYADSRGKISIENCNNKILFSLNPQIWTVDKNFLISKWFIKFNDKNKKKKKKNYLTILLY